MNETTARRRNPLSRVMTIYCVLFATFFALSTGLVSSYLYEQDMIERAISIAPETLHGDRGEVGKIP